MSEFADALRQVADDGDPHADLYARRLAGPPSLDEAPMAGDAAFARCSRGPLHDPQRGERFRMSLDLAEACALAHRPVEGRCPVCGVPGGCPTYAAARAALQAYGRERPVLRGP